MTFRKSFLEIKKSLSEDAPANSVAGGGVSGLTGIPPVPARTKFPIARRKRPMIGENKKSTITVAVPVEIDGKKYSAVNGQAYVHSITTMGRWNTTTRKMRKALKPGPHHDRVIAALEKHKASQNMSEGAAGTILRNISKINKKTKFPMDRYRDVEKRLRELPPSAARAKASRNAYEVMANKGYYPNPEPIREQENEYAFHTAGKKLSRKPRKVTDMAPADEYPPNPAINEEIEDYVVAFTLPVFIRTLEIAREKLKSDDELHMFVESIVNLQGDDVLTMDDVADVLDEYSGD